MLSEKMIRHRFAKTPKAGLDPEAPEEGRSKK
jgi:hypothetical protein